MTRGRGHRCESGVGWCGGVVARGGRPEVRPGPSSIIVQHKRTSVELCSWQCAEAYAINRMLEGDTRREERVG